MVKYYPTTLSLNETDNEMKEFLDRHDVTVIDTWRAGAEQKKKDILSDNKKK